MPPPPISAPWIARVWAERRARNLTPLWRDVLLTLRTFRGSGGLICPSHATLAARVGCCVKTVQAALAMGRTLGLVSWSERRVRAGWRWLRTSNTYRLDRPSGAVQTGLRPRRSSRAATTGNLCRGEEKLSKKKALALMLQEAAAMPDLLAARRQALSEELERDQARKMLGKWSGTALDAT